MDMRVLVSAVPAVGHVVPLLGLAQALQLAGHDVRFATNKESHRLVSSAGLRSLEAGMSLVEMRDERHRRWPETDRQPPSEWATRMWAQIMAPSTLHDLLAIVADWRPDVIVHDEGDYAGPVAAARAGIPWVTQGWGSPLRPNSELTELEEQPRCCGRRCSWVSDIETKPTPGDLLLLQAFINTFEADTGIDLLAERESANTWLHDSELVSAENDLDASSLARLRAIREAFRSLVEHSAGLGKISPTALDLLAEALEESAIGLSIEAADQPRVQAEPVGTDPVGRAVVRLLLTIRDAQLEGTWDRLKVCSRTECRWAYYDRSHSQKGRWCDISTCGNRMKNQADDIVGVDVQDVVPGQLNIIWCAARGMSASAPLADVARTFEVTAPPEHEVLGATDVLITEIRSRANLTRSHSEIRPPS
jgi:predicted RNA-binding Zn ribbon-like protein